MTTLLPTFRSLALFLWLVLSSVPCLKRKDVSIGIFRGRVYIVEVVGWGDRKRWDGKRRGLKRFWLEFFKMVIDEDSVGKTVESVFSF